MTFRRSAALWACTLLGVFAFAQATKQNPDLGFTDTPMLPNLPWHVHDPARPHPAVVTPGATLSGAPSDAVVLFDGKDLSHWVAGGKKSGPAAWKVENGYVQVVQGTGDLVSKEKFGDCQIHVEWASPTPPHGVSQHRGNSGILIMSRYEIQVLDSYQSMTYADGQAGAIYGQWPPLANAAKKPGEWQIYDIAFEAPTFENGKLVKPAYVTVFHNGVLLHHHKEMMGPMVYRQVAQYTQHDAEEPFALQNHNDPVRYRNIWIRRIPSYDHK